MPTYIALTKFRKKPTKDLIEWNLEQMEKEKTNGINIRQILWTLGRYDAVAILDAPDEKAVMKSSISRGDNFAQETLVAIPAERARKLLEGLTGQHWEGHPAGIRSQDYGRRSRHCGRFRFVDDCCLLRAEEAQVKMAY